MTDDTYDDLNGSCDPFYYEDPISERAMVIHHMAKLTDEVKDPEIKKPLHDHSHEAEHEHPYSDWGASIN